MQVNKKDRLEYAKERARNYSLRIIILILAALNIVQFIAIYSLFPLKTEKIRYVEFADGKDTVFKVLPSPLPQSSKILVIRQLARHYVEDRHKIDGITEHTRFRRVVAMSSRKMYEAFKNEYDRIKNESTFDSRDINILADTIIDEARNVHEVHFETIDRFQGKEYKNNWIVSMRYEFRKHRAKGDDLLLNPLGFTVVQYHQSKTKLTKDQINEIF